MSTVETRVPQSQEEVTQALHDAFDLITSDPTRRAMSCKNLVTCQVGVNPMRRVTSTPSRSKRCM
jgi:hypothetical protein